MFEDNKSIMTTAEVAEELGISKTHVHELRKQGILPYLKLGKTVRYEKEKLIKAIEKLQHNPIEENTNGDDDR